jgi:hypothetical protein
MIESDWFKRRLWSSSNIRVRQSWPLDSRSCSKTLDWYYQVYEGIVTTKREISRSTSNHKKKHANDNSSTKEMTSASKFHRSSRNIPPRPIYKPSAQKSYRNSETELSEYDDPKVTGHNNGQLAFEAALTEVYQPSTHLLSDDYVPYCDYTENIKIEEHQVEVPKRPSPLKDYHSNTTRADTSSPFGSKEQSHPLEADNFMSAETHHYFSSKFAELVPAPLVQDPSLPEMKSEQEKEEGAIVQRLKEVIKHHKVEVFDKELKKENSDHLNSKKWSSLCTRDEASRGNPSSKVEPMDSSSHHSEKRPPNSQHQAENLPQTDNFSSESLMVAKYDFAGEKSRDLNFKKGDIIRLIDKKANGWWLAEVDGRIGFVPSNYLISKKEFQGNN